MKNLIYLIVVAILCIGCSDDFLDKQPLDTINTENYPQTAEELVTVVNGAYQPLQRPKLYNLRMWTSDIMAGNSIVGAGGGTDGIETQDMSNFITQPDNAGVLDLWRGPWPGILMSNIVLETAPTLDIDEAIKNRSMGEAYFLRAHYYFILARYFGDVPIVTVPLNADDDLFPPRDPVNAVYDLIISDLNKAIQFLPPKSSFGQSDLGRASKGAALGMLAKVHLTLGNYDEVITLTTQVEGQGYALNINYYDNFNINDENSQESMFEVQYASDGGFGFFSDENQASWTSPFMGPRSSNFVGGAFGWNQPTQEFMNQYEAGDLRKDISVLYPGGPDFDGNAYQSSYSTTGYNVRKFLVPLSVIPGYDNSPMNFPVLRYADVLLMKAEALNELGQTNEAQNYLNMIRNRAGLDDIETGLSQVQFREAVLKERRLELAFEGQRWFDLIRVNNGQYGLDFLQSIGKDNAAQKHLLFPVPQIEIDRNPNLTQNLGY
ncbi:RagB/SusD family nutrient uptake outer membrane protein [Subsaximicrobium wynnwilliamsii]|uniref:RagB/SusD family nutrient uptake outer membrane protein n=1 Tax=Subsaximicrobium wynnwilliamsii TaxID=291179 RepID=A0A5C6ZEK4_9FLAO|nr:RagB/SusD family nutrient uptake outer membrane protein [Subsaximicrobium wynnwilliamsii]TXD82660.1 RagB/SusD family nutrient uptake outer membrane protein [Subsaximicrobium wynnwilliamsii]TXD88395.1 RagB/SusD family nutrient uptake outer membrane protein [Subsaximicrobium wynnwilliamsii]TXE02322.1 RagB/SusD family nutrient uptake outer membrane protein [Subsaximicrobium wynnwilliamsii]